MQRILDRRREFDVFGLRLARATRRPAENARRPDAGKEQPRERLVALDERAIHLGGGREHHHVPQDSGACLLCATGNWTGNFRGPRSEDRKCECWERRDFETRIGLRTSDLGPRTSDVGPRRQAVSAAPAAKTSADRTG